MSCQSRGLLRWAPLAGSALAVVALAGCHFYFPETIEYRARRDPRTNVVRAFTVYHHLESSDSLADVQREDFEELVKDELGDEEILDAVAKGGYLRNRRLYLADGVLNESFELFGDAAAVLDTTENVALFGDSIVFRIDDVSPPMHVRTNGFCRMLVETLHAEEADSPHPDHPPRVGTKEHQVVVFPRDTPEFRIRMSLGDYGCRKHPFVALYRDWVRRGRPVPPPREPSRPW